MRIAILFLAFILPCVLGGPVAVPPALDWANAPNYATFIADATGEEVMRVEARIFQALLGEKRMNVVTAESLTAGKILSTLVDVAPFGGNKYGGFGVYDSDAKRRFLGVQVPNVYSESCARQMARGALLRSRALMAIAVTGHAAQTRDMGHAHAIIGNVDMAISVRTSAATKVATQALIDGAHLYAGVPVEAHGPDANLHWGVPAYDDNLRALDSGDFATYHVHLQLCTAGSGPVNLAAQCTQRLTDIQNNNNNQGALDLQTALRAAVRRAVVYAAFRMGSLVLDAISHGAVAWPDYAPVPAWLVDSQPYRNACWEPSGVVNSHRTGGAVVYAGGLLGCETYAHIPPGPLELGNPNFIEEDDNMLRNNH